MLYITVLQARCALGVPDERYNHVYRHIAYNRCRVAYISTVRKGVKRRTVIPLHITVRSSREPSAAVARGRRGRDVLLNIFSFSENCAVPSLTFSRTQLVMIKRQYSRLCEYDCVNNTSRGTWPAPQSLICGNRGYTLLLYVIIIYVYYEHTPPFDVTRAG